jgi:hypothetical protein
MALVVMCDVRGLAMHELRYIFMDMMHDVDTTDISAREVYDCGRDGGEDVEGSSTTLVTIRSPLLL